MVSVCIVAGCASVADRLCELVVLFPTRSLTHFELLSCLCHPGSLVGWVYDIFIQCLPVEYFIFSSTFHILFVRPSIGSKVGLAGSFLRSLAGDLLFTLLLRFFTGGKIKLNLFFIELIQSFESISSRNRWPHRIGWSVCLHNGRVYFPCPTGSHRFVAIALFNINYNHHHRQGSSEQVVAGNGCVAGWLHPLGSNGTS